MTIAIKTEDVFTSDTLPFFPFEAVAGTVLHLEPARSADFVGVPASNAAVPDLSGWLAGAGGTFITASMTGSTGLNERTSKGGLHCIKTASSVFGHSGIFPNLTVRQYLLDNIDHRFFFSVWGRVTRSGNTAADAHFGLSFSTTPGTSQLLVAALADGLFYPITSALKGSSKFPLTSMVSPAAQSEIYFAAAVEGYTGTITKTAATSDRSTQLFNVGTSGAFVPGNSGAASKVFYRALIEDITVSGRDYTSLVAIDRAHFEAQVRTAGGRYHGDTYTDPATLP